MDGFSEARFLHHNQIVVGVPLIGPSHLIFGLVEIVGDSFQVVYRVENKKTLLENFHNSSNFYYIFL